MRHLGIGVMALVTLTAVAQGATDRRVSGVITAIDDHSMTLAPICAKSPVTGKIDGRTRILIDGRAGRPQDLHVTNTVKAELGLDDVWVSVLLDSRKSMLR
jgi:hypothetical protein